jgi:prolyl oligopeptidase
VPFLENVEARESIEKKLTELWNFEKFTTVSKHGKKYFYSHNSGLQNQNVYYYQESLDQTSPPQVFIDPNTLSEDGTVSITGLVFSKNGDKVAYCISEKGSDWIKIKFKDVDTMKDYDDVLQHSKFFTPTWTKDGKGK